MDILTSLVNSYYPEPHASLLNGILLGRDLFVTQTFYNELKQVGLIHIVVLSGMNITMLSAIVLNTLVYFINRKWALLCTIVIVILFVLFVGAEPPIIRAAIMGIISLGAVLYGRKTLALYSLFLSGIIMLIINFEWLQSISFQLSFAATLGIVLFGSIEHEEKTVILSRNHVRRGDDRRIQNTTIHGSFANAQDDSLPQDDKFMILKSYFLEELRISLSAQVFTLPLIFWYFRQISLISPIANILVAWMIAPIMILGMLTIVTGLVHWQFGFVLSWFVYPLLEFIVWVVEMLAKIPYGSIRL
ncbi:MAG: ComEC/Rec2 family competence protein [bacterium]|nr:ComEC/Rec2 family competence protein [bacterium]